MSSAVRSTASYSHLTSSTSSSDLGPITSAIWNPGAHAGSHRNHICVIASCPGSPLPADSTANPHVFLICHSCTVVIDVELGQSSPLTNRAQKTDFVSFGTRIPVYTKVRHSYLRVPARSFIADILHDTSDTFRLKPFDFRHPNHDLEYAMYRRMDGCTR